MIRIKTNRELIEILQQLPPDAEPVVWGYDSEGNNDNLPIAEVLLAHDRVVIQPHDPTETENEYSHRYSVTSCPKCHADLTLDSAVTIEATTEFGNAYLESCLDDSGYLEDVDDVIASGNHGDTLCTACREPLNEYEVFDK